MLNNVNATRNKLAMLVEDNIFTNKEVMFNNIKIKFTTKNVVIYTIDNGGWFKELTINADVYQHQIVEYILLILKLN